jgi:hypothetical protein
LDTQKRKRLANSIKDWLSYTMALESLSGQWTGFSKLEGNEPQFTMINIEGRTPGTALVFGLEQKYKFRSVAVGQIARRADGKVAGETANFHVFDLNRKILIPLKQYAKENGLTDPMPETTEYEARFDGGRITGSYKTSLNQTGEFELWKGFSSDNQRSELLPPEGPMDWNNFKRRIASYKTGQLLFRGQASNQFALKTSFHRTGRNNLFRYLADEIPRLRHQINAISQKYYDTGEEDLLGLLSLAQHHGFPTPLLDWTASPYVAAFFALDCLQDAPPAPDSAVRIYVFHWDEWRKLSRIQAASLIDPWPDVQFLHPSAHNNPRYYPQQSVAAFSNVEDIEGYIAFIEKTHKRRFLERIDIKASERKSAEADLRFMGITAAALFPGFEGACKALRSELFS